MESLVNQNSAIPLYRQVADNLLSRIQAGEWQENDTYGPDRYVIRRYKKSGGEYRQQSKFTISSNDQARRIVDALSRWMSDENGEK